MCLFANLFMFLWNSQKMYSPCKKDSKDYVVKKQIFVMQTNSLFCSMAVYSTAACTQLQTSPPINRFGVYDISSLQGAKP